MMSSDGKWIINLVEDDIWDSINEFNSKEEAILYGKENFEEIYEEEKGEKFDSRIYSKVFYVGKIERFIPSINVDSLLDDIVDNAYDEVGEVAEGFLSLISKEEYDLLEERLNEALSEWLDETRNQPTFWKVSNVEKVIVTA